MLRLLEQARVLVHPGYFFDFSAEAFLVVSLLPATATFAEAIDRLLPRLDRGPPVTCHTGCSIPLFSAPSTSSWGIGEFQDIGPLAGVDRDAADAIG